MAGEKENEDYPSLSERKTGMGLGSICAGASAGTLSERRSGCLPAVFMEVGARQNAEHFMRMPCDDLPVSGDERALP